MSRTLLLALLATACSGTHDSVDSAETEETEETEDDVTQPITCTNYGGMVASFAGTSSLMTQAAYVNDDTDRGFTLELWVRPTATASAEKRLLDWTQGSNGESNAYLQRAYWVVDVADGQAQFESHTAYSGSGSETPGLGATSTSTLAVDEWHHVAIVVDGTVDEVRIYVDGVLETTTGSEFAAWWAAPMEAGHVLYIGGRDSMTFTGMIDDVRLWNSPLSQYVIRAQMCGPVSEDPVPSGLVDQFTFDDGFTPASGTGVFENNGPTRVARP